MKTLCIILFMVLSIGSSVLGQNNINQNGTNQTSSNGIFSTSPTTNGNLNYTGSVSGVNPAGNPGTIIAHSANSNSGNIAAEPVSLEPPLNSSPNYGGVTYGFPSTLQNGGYIPSERQGAVNIPPTRIEPLPNAVASNANNPEVGWAVAERPVRYDPPAKNTVVPGTTNNGNKLNVVIISGPVETNVTGTVSTKPSVTATAKKPVVPETSPDTLKITSMPINIESRELAKLPTVPVTRIETMPILNTYIPENMVSLLTKKYGGKLYDITRVRIAGSDRYSYIVRLQEKGIYSAELVEEVR